MRPHNEIVFETDIVKGLCRKNYGSKPPALSFVEGYLEGTPENYDAENALYPEDLVTWLKATQAEIYNKLAEKHGETQVDAHICREVGRYMDSHGALKSLRRGVEFVGAKFDLAQFKPDNLGNAATKQKYDANILRVVRQIKYSPFHKEMLDATGHGSGILDLVIFLNGIPVATLELKTDFTQSVQHAIKQYKADRKPFNQVVRKAEPLLAFNRRALVHFAVSNDEVYMTTRLNGENTFFLPFNRGNGDASGNPPNADGHATSYLWEQVLEKETFLRVIGRFLHVQDKDEEGKKLPPEKHQLIFPRYHQLDSVSKLIAAAAHEGPGYNYLIQHSAGSGKSNSIAWLAHQLAALTIQDGAQQGKSLFRNVIVITDRTVLDSQLQDTIYQFEHQQGVVVRISNEDGMGSKSEKLRAALLGNAPIIIVTLQTFPFVLEEIRKQTSLREHTFAVIADEAHSSQTGESARKVKEVLQAEQTEEDEEISGEDLLRMAVEKHRAAKNISYFAFTATPKPKTLETFGRLIYPDKPKSTENTPVPFHLYTMKQAIEEGFILDVLKNYITYDVAYKLAHQNADREVDVGKAKAQINKWVRLHPFNISQKIQIIVEHFRTQAKHMLNGQAKAMVVTGSRKEAVRYKLELDRYIAKQGYSDVHALVAFSGEVIDKESGDEPFTERNMNRDAKSSDLRKEFDKIGFSIMIVANKFLTGFDQPKLSAMYVDKKLAGVDCVQTLSRLNRTYRSGNVSKDMTFILDFVNKAEDVKEAFEPFYKVTHLNDNSDPNDIFGIKNRLIDARIFTVSQVEAFAEEYYSQLAKKLNKKQEEMAQGRLNAIISVPVNEFRGRFEKAVAAVEAAQAGLVNAKQQSDAEYEKHARNELNAAKEVVKELEAFKTEAGNYTEFYEFMSNIVDYESEELEKFYVFLKFLRERLKSLVHDDRISLEGLLLSHYKIHSRRENAIKLDAAALDVDKPIAAGGPDRKKDKLSKIIEQLNELFEGEFNGEDILSFGESLKPRVLQNEDVVSQMKAGNTVDQIMLGDYPKVLSDAVLGTINTHQNISSNLLGDEKRMEQFARVMLRVFMDNSKVA